MKTKGLLIKILIVFTAFSAFQACSPHEPILYDRIIIDTYKPTTLGFIITDTYVTLFDSSGDADGGDPWTDPDPAPGESIAEDNDGNLTYFPFGRIEYTGGLMSGIYYIRVRLADKGDSAGAYAIRVITDNPDVYTGWFFASTNPGDTGYESDDPQTGGVPTDPVPISIGEKHNRYLDSDSDVDWFRLVLP